MKSITGISRKVKHLQMKPVDFILIILLMIASFSPFLLLRGNQQPGQIAQLRVNSQVVKTFDLRKDQTYTYRDQAHDDINKIEVRDGQIAIVYANCGDQICVRKGYIGKTGQTIVCLPHRLVIEIMGATDDDKARDKKDRIVDYQ